MASQSIPKSMVKVKDDVPLNVGGMYCVIGPNSMHKKMIFNGINFVELPDHQATLSTMKRKHAGDLEADLLDQMGREMTCPVCLDFFTDPVMLSCSHSFCRKCLVGIFDAHDINLGVNCPSCRKRLKVKKLDVANLPQNLVLMNTISRFQQLTNEQEEKRQSQNFCVNHKKERVTMFCNDCEVLICYLCLCCEGPHEGHKALPSESAYKKFKETFSSMKTTLQNALENANSISEAGELQVVKNKFSTEVLCEDFKRLIDCCYGEILNKIRSKKDDLVKQLEQKSEKVQSMVREPCDAHTKAVREAKDMLDSYQRIINAKDRQTVLEKVKDIPQLTNKQWFVENSLYTHTYAVKNLPEDKNIQKAFESLQDWVFEMEKHVPKLWLQEVFGIQFNGHTESGIEEVGINRVTKSSNETCVIVGNGSRTDNEKQQDMTPLDLSSVKRRGYSVDNDKDMDESSCTGNNDIGNVHYKIGDKYAEICKKDNHVCLGIAREIRQSEINSYNEIATIDTNQPGTSGEQGKK